MNVTDRPKAIVLGGTAPHIALITNLKERGYYIILIDYLVNPPARCYADIHLQESSLDHDKVLEIAKKYSVSLVISTCVDQANATACFVAERLGLPHPYSYETALCVTNKGLMKKVMIENAIPTSPYRIIHNSNDAFPLNLSLPVVVKPVDSNGSKGVKKISEEANLVPSLENAIKISRTGTAIVEEFVKGNEIQIDCFSHEDGSVDVIMIRQKQKGLIETNDVLQSLGSIIPANLSSAVSIKITSIADKIAQSFGLKNTPFFIQALVDGESINIIEFAPRIGGGLSYDIIKKITSVDIIDSAINSFLGIKSTINIQSPALFFSTNLIYMKTGVFSGITGYEELLEQGIIEEFYIQKVSGTFIGGDMTSNNRVAAFLVKAATQEELYHKTKISINNLEVWDVDGNPVMRKELNLSSII